MNGFIDFAARLQSAGLAGAALIMVVKATLILAIIRLMLAALPRVSAATKHLLITIALVSVIVLPLMSVAVPVWQLALLPSPAPQQEIGSLDESRTPLEIADPRPSAVDTTLSIAKATGVVNADRLTRMQTFVETIRQSWKGMLLIGVIAVSAIFLGQMFAGMLGVWMVARKSAEVDDRESLEELDAACAQLGLDRPVRLLRSSNINVPVIWGVYRPVLLLPAGSENWPVERLRVVLMHELAHLKRSDGVTLLVTRMAAALYWFHPMVWSLERTGRNECERACDDLVLASGAKASDYADHLLAIVKALPQVDPFRNVTLAMSRRSNFEGRLLSILEPGVRRRNMTARIVGIAAVATLFLIVPIAAVRVVAQPSPNAPLPQLAANDSNAGSGGGNEAGSQVDVIEEGDSENTSEGEDSNEQQYLTNALSRVPDYVLAKISGKRRTPRTGSEWNQYAYEMHRSDRYEEAIAAWKESIDHGYNIDGAMYNIACAYSLMDDKVNALKWLRDALDNGFSSDRMIDDSDLDPIRATPEFRALLAHARGGRPGGKHDRYQATLDSYQQLRAESSTDGDDWYDVGLDLLRLRKLSEASDAFRQAIRLGEKTSSSLYNLACAYSLEGKSDLAVETLRQAVDAGFDGPDKMQNDPDLANARRHSGYAGIHDLAEALSLKEYHESRGNWFEDPRDAVRHYESKAQQYSHSGRAWFNLGYVRLQARDLAGSVDAFKKALDLGFRPGTSAYNIACAYARMNDRENAFTWLEKARANGFALYNYLWNDEDLDNLHSDPRFDKFRELAKAEKRKAEKEKALSKKHDSDDDEDSDDSN